jgi:uncharacterized protein (DUF779 family)
MVERVLATPKAIELIERLKVKYVLLGRIGDCPLYMGEAQFEYWKHTQLIIDVVEGRGGMFSLEGSEGLRFLTRSRVFSDDELEGLRG